MRARRFGRSETCFVVLPERSHECCLCIAVDSVGSAVVVAGSKESCDQAAELFNKIGMKTEVRQVNTDEVWGARKWKNVILVYSS